MSVRRDSLQSSQAQRTCAKHPQKLATHQLAGKATPQDAFYCQKCSIMLASQGYNVIKLANIVNVASGRKGSFSSRNSRGSCPKQYSILSNRKNEISSFMEGLESLNFEITRKIQDIQDYLIKSQSGHGRMIQEANKFYKQLEEAIQLQKYITYNSILNKRLMDESKARQSRDAALEACQQIQAIINDIRENMDAVQTVDYSIYNAIMGGYQAKVQKFKTIGKEALHLKPIQKLQIQFPQIPKALLSVSNKISIIVKKQGISSTHNSIPNSVHNSIHNSIVTTIKPQKIIVEDDQVCMSQQSNEISQQIMNNQDDYGIQQQNITKNQQIAYKPKQIIKTKGNIKQLAFSFDQNSNHDNQKQVKIYEDLSDQEMSNLMVIKGFQQGKLSKIQQRMNSKQVCQSRESLGQYLNISTSRERHFAQDTQTLLIV